MISQINVLKVQLMNLSNLRDLAMRSHESELVREIENVMIEIFILDSRLQESPLYQEIKSKQQNPQ